MQISKFFKNLWFFSATYFTAVSTAIILAVLILSSGDSAAIGASFLDPVSMLRVLLLALILGTGSAIYRLDGITPSLATSLHAIIYVSGFFIFLWLSADYQNGNNNRLATAAIGTVILALIYAAVMVGIKLIPKAIKNGKKKAIIKKDLPEIKEKTEKKAKKEGKEPYKNQFS